MFGCGRKGGCGRLSDTPRLHGVEWRRAREGYATLIYSMFSRAGSSGKQRVFFKGGAVLRSSIINGVSAPPPTDHVRQNPRFRLGVCDRPTRAGRRARTQARRKIFRANATDRPKKSRSATARASRRSPTDRSRTRCVDFFLTCTSVSIPI